MSKNNSSPLVSVVIPVYKVEKYLRRCVDSVLSQTYSNIEVILVDDGSPDICGDICEQYAESDRRVKVIHRQNGGLSAARNTGIDASKGNFLFFIDSDDAVAGDSIEYFMSTIQKDHSDIAIGSFQLVDERMALHPISSKEKHDEKSIIMNSEQVLTDSLYELNSTFHAWGKLYKKELFNDVRYPEGELYEDVGTTYKLYLQAAKISVCLDKKYYYTVRKGSITHSHFQPKMMDSIKFAKIILDVAEDTGVHSLKQAAKTYVFMSAVYMFEMLISSDEIKEFQLQFLECVSIIKKLRWSVATNTIAPQRTRLYSVSSLFGMFIFGLVLNIKNSVKNRG